MTRPLWINRCLICGAYGTHLHTVTPGTAHSINYRDSSFVALCRYHGDSWTRFAATFPRPVSRRDPFARWKEHAHMERVIVRILRHGVSHLE